MEVDLPDRSIRCIVKLAKTVIGGAAITCKNELEKIHDENLEIVASQLREAMMEGSGPNKIIGMDWSKKPGSSHITCNVDESGDHQSCHFSPFVVVHGAGSFGHFQASRSGVHRGGLDKPIVKAGFVATRISVTNLNLQIVRALAREGLPTIGVSPFPSGWSTSKRDVASADLSTLAKTIHSGFVPVLHGDAVLDHILGCTILSGDVIIRHLAHHLKPQYVVFLTDVLGVYDRPPSEPDAVLLKEIAVGQDGSWRVVNPVLEHTNKRVETSVAAHDTTGGMETKISEAAMIAKLGIDVYIVKAATIHSQRALSGDLRYGVPEDWLGTIIKISEKNNL